MAANGQRVAESIFDSALPHRTMEEAEFVTTLWARCRPCHEVAEQQYRSNPDSLLGK